MMKNIFKIENTAMLAPMAGFTDSSFRRICRSAGASLTVSEMVSAKALRMGDKKTPLLMQFDETECPYGIQLFGDDPEDIAFAARFAEETFAPDFIDINMGCPAPKITGGGAGSKLMTTPQLAAELVAAAVSATSLPVTAKIRAGFKEETAQQLAPMLEQAGAAFLTVHGRTRDQMYHPPINLDIIKAVKEAVSIPVVGNGDILSAEDALQMKQYTGCDAVMIGRGALGDPFLFTRVNAALQGLPIPEPATLKRRIDTLRLQGELTVAEKGEYVALREMRKHAAYYMKGLKGAAKLRADAGKMSTLQDLYAICDAALAAGTAREE